MFYNLREKNFKYDDVFYLKVEIDGEECFNTIFLDKCEDSLLLELGFARVVEEEKPQIYDNTQELVKNEGLNEGVYKISYVVQDKPLEVLKELKLQEINNAYENAILNLQKEHIPTSEMLTFETQERESKAYKESGFSDVSLCPTMQIIAQARGIELRALCEKALSKAELFRNASAQLIGKRQGLQDLVEIAETKEDLENIRWE